MTTRTRRSTKEFSDETAREPKRETISPKSLPADSRPAVHLTLTASDGCVVLARDGFDPARFGLAVGDAPPNQQASTWRDLLGTTETTRPTADISRRALSLLIFLASHPRRHGEDLRVSVAALRALDEWKAYRNDGPLGREARRLVAGELIRFADGEGSKGASQAADMILGANVHITLKPSLSNADNARQWMSAHDPWPTPGLIPETGLLSSEVRDEIVYLERHRQLIESAQHEIAICALSGNQTLNGLMAALKERLAHTKIYMMIIHPERPQLASLTASQGCPVKKDIERTIHQLRAYGLHPHKNFSIRFMDTLPPFMAIMIDGDITSTGAPASRTARGEIRAQPVSADHNLRDGVILHVGRRVHGFDWFEHIAKDLRQRWSEAKEDKKLLP